MTGVVIDTDRLARGLEAGIGQVDGFLDTFPSEQRLRLSVCGIASAAIVQYAQDAGVSARLLYVAPQLTVDPDMEHVVAVVGDRTVVDATCSQFLGYVGLTTGYERALGKPVFPPEKVQGFEIDKPDTVLRWLMKSALAFRRSSTLLPNGYGPMLGSGALRFAPLPELRDVFAQIYEPEAMRPWEPSDEVSRATKIIAAHIPPGSITLSSSCDIPVDMLASPHPQRSL